jgi:hypothetical protein
VVALANSLQVLGQKDSFDPSHESANKFRQLFPYETEALQHYDDAVDDLRQLLHGVKHRRTLQGQSCLELYLEKGLSLVFDLRSSGESIHDSVAASPDASEIVDSAAIILDLQAASGCPIQDRDEEFVFVSNVQCVQGPNGVIPSVVRLYIVNDQIEQSGVGLMYFSALERVYKVIFGIPERESGVRVKNGRNEGCNGFNPSQIKSGFEIVHSIPEHKGNLLRKSFGRTIFHDEFSSLVVSLDDGSVRVRLKEFENYRANSAMCFLARSIFKETLNKHASNVE